MTYWLLQEVVCSNSDHTVQLLITVLGHCFAQASLMDKVIEQQSNGICFRVYFHQ